MAFLAHGKTYLGEVAACDRVLLCLDYDGTLAPIVADPAKAFLPPATRDVLVTLLRNPRVTTAFVSGRAADKVQGFLGLGDGSGEGEGARFITAGSHGFDIRGCTGDGTPLRCSVADAYRPALEAGRDFLAARLAGIPGASVEDNRFAVSAHWRNVPHERAAEVEAAVDAFIASPANQLDGSAGPALEKRPGKCVWELRPAMDWNKGRAVEWILRTLLPMWASRAADKATKVAVVVIGDDATDEDMFKAALAAEGSSDDVNVLAFPVIVTEPIAEPASSLASPKGETVPAAGQPFLPRRAAIGRKTHALAFLRDPADVANFLSAQSSLP